MLEAWKYEADLVKSSIDRAGDLEKGLWNSCSDILEEWGIGEIEEYLFTIESLVPKIEAVERVRVASAADIQDLVVVDSEAIHFSLISPCS